MSRDQLTIGKSSTATAARQIPALIELQNLNQWVAWKYKPNGKDKPKKPPIDPTTGYPTDATDPAVWQSFTEAAKTAKRHKAPGTGIALSKHDNLSFEDFDDCLDPSIPNPTIDDLDPWARDIVKERNSYTEISPSGTGVKLYEWGKMPGGITSVFPVKDGVRWEVYSGKHFATITGNHLPGTPDTINDGQKALDSLVYRFGPHSGNQGVSADTGYETDMGERFKGRSNELSHYTGMLKGEKSGLPDDIIKPMIRAMNEAKYTEPLPDDELESTVFKSLSTWKRGKEPTPPESVGWQLMTTTELAAMPKPEFVIDGILAAGTHSMIFGDPGSYKTFIALHAVASVATGIDFFGHKVKQGIAVFIAAEGFEALPERMEGWQTAHQITTDKVYFLPESPQLINPEHVEKVATLVNEAATAASMPAGLIVIDTVAETSLGINENSTDMQPYMHAARGLAKLTGAAVLLIHHSNKAGNGYRGSSSIGGSVYTAISVEREDTHERIISLRNDKNRMTAEFETLYLKGELIDVDGSERGTVVFTKAPEGVGKTDPDALGMAEARALVILQTRGREGITSAEWERLFREYTQLSGSTFDRAKRELKGRGRVRTEGRRFFPLTSDDSAEPTPLHPESEAA